MINIFRAIAVVLLCAFAGAHVGQYPQAVQVSLLTVLIVFLWATSIVPEFFASLVFLAIVLVSGVATEAAALAGFQSKAVWLAFSGIILGAAIQQHKLGGVLFNRLLRRAQSYNTLVWSIALAGLLLSFVVPSAMGRVVMMAPLVLAICDRLELDKGSPGRMGLCLAMLAGTVFPAMSILPSNVPNVVMLGAMEASIGHGVTYVDYFRLNFPVLGMGSFLILPLLICRLFPGHIEPVTEDTPPHSWTGEQKRLAVLLLCTLVMWGTDSLHGISAAWIGLAAAVICMTPVIGVISAQVFNTLNFGPWFFVAGAIGLGAVVRESGLVNDLWQGLSSIIPLASLSAPLQYASLVVMTMVIAVLSTLPAMPSIFTPMAAAVSQTIGWPVDATILAQVPAFVLFMFPYQAPPIIIGIAMLGVPVRQAMKLLVSHTFTGLLILVPLHYLWGRAIGVFP
jgi:di/tricarboxylate transporter